MAVENRVRGQEVVVRLARGRQVEEALTAIKSFTLQFDFAVLSEQYLGETSMRKDDIFNGVSGTLEFDHQAQDLFLFVEFLKQRAQRNPNFPVNTNQVNATATITFPNGDTPRIIVRDMKFGAIPVNIAGRDQYVGSSFPFESGEAPRILTT